MSDLIKRPGGSVGLMNKALQTQKLAQITKENGLNDVLKKLEILRKEVGVKEKIELSEGIRIVKFLKNYFGTITIGELEVAFDWMMAGKIPEINHYNSFSKSYVAKVINAYAKYKHQRFKKIVAQSVDKKKIREEFKESLCDRVRIYKKRGVMSFMTDYVHEFFVLMGELSEEVVVEDRVKKMAKLDLQERVGGEKKKMLRAGEMFDEWKNLGVSMQKKEEVRRLFEMCDEEDLCERIMEFDNKKEE